MVEATLVPNTASTTSEAKQEAIIASTTHEVNTEAIPEAKMMPEAIGASIQVI
jgi:hypothetical protein